ncbi:MAG: methyltransferase domain-containing protein [Rhizobiales bacterium]|nr:methyltransferase domain-containing protein [Hyphomicrobiales bacterium]
MTSLVRRSHEAELMDTEAVPFEEFRECLRHLEFINRCTLAYRPTLGWLDRLLGRTGTDRPVSILDVGFGHGDMLRQISSWGRKRGVEVRLAGIDLNPWSARAAALATPADMPIRYEVGNVFSVSGDRVDIVLSSLFAHHLPDAELVRFIRWMDASAELGWFVNDLHRHALPYHFIRMTTRMLPANRLVRHDAPVSVARGFTRRDWLGLLDQSGIDPSRATIEWSFPFRFGVGFVR